jgi:hypothetical protein
MNGPRQRFEHVDQFGAQRYVADFIGLGVFRFHANETGFEIHAVPEKTQDLPLPHGRVVGHLDHPGPMGRTVFHETFIFFMAQDAIPNAEFNINSRS